MHCPHRPGPRATITAASSGGFAIGIQLGRRDSSSYQRVTAYERSDDRPLLADRCRWTKLSEWRLPTLRVVWGMVAAREVMRGGSHVGAHSAATKRFPCRGAASPAPSGASLGRVASPLVAQRATPRESLRDELFRRCLPRRGGWCARGPNATLLAPRGAAPPFRGGDLRPKPCVLLSKFLCRPSYQPAAAARDLLGQRGLAQFTGLRVQVRHSENDLHYLD